MATELLQSGLQFREPLQFSPGPTPLLEAAKPLKWLHVSKTGTSWFNVLIHTPGLCPLLPAGVVLDQSQFCLDCGENGLGLVADFQKQYPIASVCPGSFDSPEEFGHHFPLGNQRAVHDWHGVTILRRPESRIVSGYNYLKLDWPEFAPRPCEGIDDYKTVVQGCYVRSLTRDGLEPLHNRCHLDMSLQGNVRPDEVEEAKRRLDRFAFVGILEEWNLSVCLWHVMFGGLCYGSDFEKVRPGSGSPVDLKGFLDEADDEVYEHGQQIFERNKRRYVVSMTVASRVLIMQTLIGLLERVVPE
eukprot:CAMPEP_0171080820 /NCGR_PEP_ID=MMETSP0766_2-20121228/16107_1 /TAXON_ID=439317 /ORGANISM="Gambierdiscus australes, Strain CAWD 149" /LENGTH=300 /DNA_ID=CAMNT_0011538091 /DNA_START=27 /DNA_END=927 /DNA_ORIENTATION=+